ncbi:DLA class II histocompatibility antigen, DR-1 beta chain-like [Trichechus inunguis]
MFTVPIAHFLEQAKSECHFTNGTELVRFVQRFIYNQEYVLFDSDAGKFMVVTESGRPNVKCWNSQKDLLNNRRAVVNREACPKFEPGFEERQEGSLARVTLSSSLVLSAFSLLVEPVVTVYPAKTQPLQHHSLLVCSVNGFYPGHIEVRWFQNGDWTFHILVMLETIPQSGKIYSCQVEHPSLTSPVTVEWRAQSESAQSKMLSGIQGLALGLLFLGAGLLIHFRNQKVHSGLQPTGLLS